MSYWQEVQAAAGMGGHYHWVLLGCVVAAFALAAVAPQAKKRLRASLLLIVLSFALMLVCGLMRYRGVLGETDTGYRWVHYASQLCLAVAVINLAGVLLFRVLLPMLRLQPPPILRDVILGVLYIAAALALLTREGVDLTGVVATGAVLTAIIGFSLQDTLGNVMGGMSLQMERLINVGDWVRVGDVEGRVSEIRWRQTSIETRNWDTVVIPNSLLTKSQVTILGRREGRPPLHRMWVPFNVDYRHGPAEVIEAVERALRAEPIPNVATDPQPDCVLKDFKDSYALYSVRFWIIDLSRDDPTSSEVKTRIFVALQRAGMSLSIPAQSVFMTLEGRGRAERKRREELDRRVGALKKVAVLEPLTEQERADLAGRMTVAPFRRGEVITRQGNEAHYLYIITKGEAEVRVAGRGSEDAGAALASMPGSSRFSAGGDGHGRRVATLKAGDVFGEMALMTGEPRSATVIALTDVVCYRLGKEGFQEALHRRPELAEAISRLLAARKIELDAVNEGLSAAAARDRKEKAEGDLLQRIKKFFTLG